MCLLDNLSYNLGGSGLGQGIHKEHFFGAEGLAHALSHLIPQLTAQFLFLIMSRSQNHKGDRPLTLDLMRNTHSGGLRDRRMLNESRFYLRRTCAAPGYLDGVIRPPLEEPEAILVHVGPISMEPDIFPKAGEIRLNVPVRVIQETLGHGGSRTPADQISQLAQLLTHPPQTSVVRPVWRPLIYHHGGAEEVGPNDLPRTHHPTDVCHPEEHVVRFHVKCVAQFLGHLSQAARMCMHRAFWTSGGTGGEDDH